MARTPSAVAVLAVAAVLGACVPAALATFPGANGKIAFITQYWPEGCGDCDPLGNTAWITARGERPARLGATFWPTRIGFSPSGRYVLYQGPRGAMTVMGPDGASRRRLGNSTGAWAWSPLGGTVAYGGNAGLAVVGVSGEGRRVIWPGAYVRDVVWSPSGRRLAFAEPETWDPRGDLMRVVGSDGQAQQDLGYGHALDWSASGWVSYRRGTSLFAIRPGHTEEIVLVRGLLHITNVVMFGERDYGWSPDGQRIAFSAHDRVWVQGVPDGDRRAITKRGFGFLGWSPDGRFVACSGKHGIYAAPARGGQPRLLARNPDPRTGSEYPAAFDWQPRPSGRAFGGARG